MILTFPLVLWYKINPEILSGTPERGHQTRLGTENKI